MVRLGAELERSLHVGAKAQSIRAFVLCGREPTLIYNGSNIRILI